MNFNAGPATLPEEALIRAKEEFLDIAGSGMSIMEHSHRAKVYEGIHNEAVSLVRELMNVGPEYDVLLMQGGASGQFATVPLNLLKPGSSADYIVTGTWAKKALGEAKGIGTVRVAATTEKDKKFPRVPGQSELELDPKATYCHITSNNTIAGTQFMEFPETGDVPLIADMSSDIMWRPMDIKPFGVIYAGAQKNLGPSGIVLVIIRKELVENGRKDIPTILQYRTHAAENSLYHTPPTFSIYMLRNVLDIVKSRGGLAAMETHNREKAKLIYDAMDQSSGFYTSPVEPSSRSLMNIVFNLPTEELEAKFIAEASKQGMVGLKGHRSVGGVRASIYNAAPQAWCEALASFMVDFQKRA
jgi:phosphoserine aminotransferase